MVHFQSSKLESDKKTCWQATDHLSTFLVLIFMALLVGIRLNSCPILPKTSPLLSSKSKYFVIPMINKIRADTSISIGGIFFDLTALYRITYSICIFTQGSYNGWGTSGFVCLAENFCIPSRMRWQRKLIGILSGV